MKKIFFLKIKIKIEREDKINKDNKHTHNWFDIYIKLGNIFKNLFLGGMGDVNLFMSFCKQFFLLFLQSLPFIPLLFSRFSLFSPAFLAHQSFLEKRHCAVGDSK
ncbi:unnamed protein product [Meloidogyne enterolobii]|uniref:Uncharacterized protein n=1 Tax=Meloidogyne enterolobii TaxID=390850 RepID=A0ACB1AA81_MELEN